MKHSQIHLSQRNVLVLFAVGVIIQPVSLGQFWFMPVIQHLLAASFRLQVSQVNNGLYCVMDIPFGACPPPPWSHALC